MKASRGQTSAASPRSKQIEGSLVQALASTDSLLGRCVAGDRSAWRELHRSLHPAVVAFVRQMGVGPEDVEDVCQDVFLQIARYLPQFEHRAELKTWVYKICASQATRLRRKRALRRVLAGMLRMVTPVASAGAHRALAALDAQKEMELALVAHEREAAPGVRALRAARPERRGDRPRGRNARRPRCAGACEKRASRSARAARTASRNHHE